MNEETQQLLDKSERAIHAAETLLEAGDADFAAGRAYYAMFYITEALLVEKGFKFRKHGGVHAAFGEHFVKTGQFDAKFHRFLLDAYDMRVNGDYGVEICVSSDEVLRLIQHAREFLQEARRYLNASE